MEMRGISILELKIQRKEKITSMMRKKRWGIRSVERGKILVEKVSSNTNHSLSFAAFTKTWVGEAYHTDTGAKKQFQLQHPLKEKGELEVGEQSLPTGEAVSPPKEYIW